MKRIKMIVGFVVALAILGAVSAPTASAQVLNGVWLKCKVADKGYSVNLATGDYSKLNRSVSVYLNFIWDEALAQYNVALWTNPGGVWNKWYTGNAATNNPGENFIPDFYLYIVTSITGTDFINTVQSPFLNLKFKDGILTKVTYKGTGISSGMVEDGTLNYYGYCNISGTSVDESKLPFTPY